VLQNTVQKTRPRATHDVQNQMHLLGIDLIQIENAHESPDYMKAINRQLNLISSSLAFFKINI
jgi:hypothetical protein